MVIFSEYINVMTWLSSAYVCVCDQEFGEYWCFILGAHLKANENNHCKFGNLHTRFSFSDYKNCSLHKDLIF